MSKLRYGRISTSALIFLCNIFILSGYSDQKDTNPDYTAIIKALTARSIGPALMGGRGLDVAVVESNTSIIYASVGPSGLWKSESNGITWEPVFENEGSVAIGAVDVSQSNPDIVWVGTGEASARNSSAIGDGVYKSEDGGKSWKNMGLENTRFISQIIIDRINPDIVYVGAQGHLWGPNPERGLYKTLNGGKSWEKILYVDENTGVADFAIDPSNNKVLYAATWEHRRKPYHFSSGGKGSHLYKTTDAGETWKELTTGLPEGPYGRIGVDVCRSKPNVVYAVIESKKSGVFRSDDKGETWTRTCDPGTYERINHRPFYYSKITADPNNDLVVYVYSAFNHVSRDGGKTYNIISGDTHTDHHALWVNPFNSQHLIDINDGGIDISFDGAKSWHGVKTNAWSELYQIGFDMRDPYYVYVGIQDNGSWGGPVNSMDPLGIMNYHWYCIGGGDGNYVQVDPTDYTTLYRNAHMGSITRFDVKTGDSQDIRPTALLKNPSYRFNWGAPILISPHNPKVVYFGGNFLFKTTDRGNSWTKISPDLSTNDPNKQKDSGGITADNTGAEVHCTIYTIAESPQQEGVIWVGTDDGLIQITKDGGKNWVNVTGNIKGLPGQGLVSRIEASHFEAGTAYMTYDAHRFDDYNSYIFRTRDFGKTWVSLTSNLPKIGYLHVVREDLKNPNLLFVGSEFGLFLSFDGGKKWWRYQNDFPTIAVRDIQIHPRERDLLIATHGRGLWVLDDITALEALTPDALQKEAVLFKIRPATLYSYKQSDRYQGPYVYAAPNPEYGACLTYYLKAAPGKSDRLTLTIFDLDGKEVQALQPKKAKGLNRIYWNLREKGLSLPTARSFSRRLRGPFVLPGEYRAVLELNGVKSEQSILVKAFEKHSFSQEERKLNRQYVKEISGVVWEGYQLMNKMQSLKEQLDDLKKRITDENISDSSLKNKLSEVIQTVAEIQRKYSFGIGGGVYGYGRSIKVRLRGGTLPEQISGLLSRISRYQGAPTQTQIVRYNDLKSTIQSIFDHAERLIEKDLQELNQLLSKNHFPMVK
jgi:photosystem II stability/assembly factor-like uncharacterized protein/cell division septum initiation protein DivIVA